MSVRSRDPFQSLWAELGVNSTTMLHRGDASILYRARSDGSGSGRPVVVKLLNARSPSGGRDEVDLWRPLSVHKGIQPILRSGLTGSGRSYVVTEYCADGSYDQVLRSSGPLPVEEAVAVGERIARGLKAVHTHELLHHAVTPDNILRTRFGAALIDFGAAQPLDRPFPPVYYTLRTLEHAPPEELLGGNPSPASDVYRLTSALWTLLAGHAPFAGAGGAPVSPNVYRSRLLSTPAPPVPRDDVPDWLRAVLAQGLAKEPDQRIASADDLRRALSQEAAPPPPTVLPDAPVTSGDASYAGAGAEQHAAPSKPAGREPARRLMVPEGAHTPYGAPPHVPSGPQDTGLGVHPPVDIPVGALPPPRSRSSRVRPVAITGAAALVVLAGGLGVARLMSDASENEDARAESEQPKGAEGEPDERVSEDDVAGSVVTEEERPDRDADLPDIAPTGLEIRDGTISATLSWTDGSGGTASHYVVGGPVGEEAATLANAAAGTSEVEVNGLNPDVEYCFKVVAVQSTDAMVPSEELCTTRDEDNEDGDA